MTFKEGSWPGFYLFPEIEEYELESAPDGLYELKGQAEKVELYDPVNNLRLPPADHRKLVRIDSGGELPDGMVLATFRSDGRRLIIALVPVEASGHAEWNLLCPCWLNGKPWPPEFFPATEGAPAQ